MDETQYEYHDHVEEFFPMRETVKGRKQFSKKSSGAAGLLATASAGILAAAVTLLLLFCNTLKIEPSSASFRTTVYNAKDTTQIYYYVIPGETVSQNREIQHILQGWPTGPDTEELFLGNAVDSGPVSSQRDAFEVEGLEPNTRYIIAFFDKNPEGMRFLNAVEFTTGGPGLPEEPPTPVETIPALPTEETSAPTETVPETTEETEPETVPETTEETQPETVPETTAPPYQPPVYKPPKPTTPPPTETVPPPTETVPPPTETVPSAEEPTWKEITIVDPELVGGRTMYRVSAIVDMKGYALHDVDVFPIPIDDTGNNAADGTHWEQDGSMVTVSSQIYLSAAKSVRFAVRYVNNDGNIADRYCDTDVLPVLGSPEM